MLFVFIRIRDLSILIYSFYNLGLDPAGPWFENVDHPDIGLDVTDALLVDVMHTDGEPNIIM